MEMKTITLANQPFNISISADDSERREKYFKDPKGKSQLTGDELKLLKALGIDNNSKKAQAINPYMARFFDQLPLCQSDTSLVLAKDCEVVHFVLWYTMFANRENIKENIDKYNEIYNPLADISVALDNKFVNMFKNSNKPIITKDPPQNNYILKILSWF